jgi:hypothetical protein
MPLWASPWRTQTPGPVSEPPTSLIAQHAKRLLQAHLLPLLLTQLVLVTEPLLKMLTRIAHVSNATETASCTRRHFDDWLEKHKSSFSLMIISAHASHTLSKLLK